MSPVVSRQFHQTFRALTFPAYRIFAVGQLVGTFGFWLQTTAVSWLVLELSGDSGTALGMVLALQFGPFLLFGLQGGKIADAFDKRRILAICSTGSALVAASLATVVLTGVVELWQVYLAVFVFGCLAVVEGPARQAFNGELVDRETLPNAISMGSAIFNISRISGPALAGVLIALTSTGAVIAINAVAFLGPVVANLMLLRMRLSNPVKRDADTSGGIREALRYVAARPDLLGVLIVTLFVGGFAFNFALTLSLLAKTEFGSDADTFGLLLTALSIGALIGALVSGRRHSRPSAFTVLYAAMGLGAGTVVVGFAPTFLTAAILLVPTGFAMSFFGQSANLRVQMGVPGDFRGRIMSLYMLVFLGSTPLCAPIIGWVSEAAGARAGLWLGGGISLAAALVGCAAKVVRVRRRVLLPVGKL